MGAELVVKLATNVKVRPVYASINAVADICEPWIEQWGGDEWGDSMRNLHGACHTSYGFSDEDCALFATKLIENLEAQKEWMDAEGYAYGFMEPDDLAAVREECRKLRAYWWDGGNLTGDTGARETIELMPSWLFEDDQKSENK